MSFMKWEDRYSLKIQAMDAEHQKLISIFNEVYDLLNDDHSEEVKRKSKITELVNYTKLHFEHEEKFMQEKHFPDFNKHKTIHEDLLKTLTDLIAMYKPGDKAATSKIVAFLKTWLQGHIMVIDRKYSDFVLNGKKVA